MVERQRYAEPPRCSAAVVIGSGPSLSAEDVAEAMAWRSRGEGRMVFVVNSTYRAAPAADVLYAGDFAWLERTLVHALECFRGQIWTGSAAAAQKWEALKLVRRVRGDVIPYDGICVGGQAGNSGLQALCLAALCGAKRIALLGFDGAPATSGRTHWHPAHEAPLQPCFGYAEWPGMFYKAAPQLVARGVSVVNCTRESVINAFALGRLAEWTCS